MVLALALSVGLRADERGAACLAQDAGHELGGRGRVAIDQHDDLVQGQTAARRIAGLVAALVGTAVQGGHEGLLFQH